MVLRFLMLAGIFFLISCTDFVRNNPDDPGGENYAGNNYPTPSSSSGSVWRESDITGTGFTKKIRIDLGNLYASTGSFLDIDGDITKSGSGEPMRYRIGEVADHLNEIDLIYDGTNLWTPVGCIVDANCPSTFRSAITGSTSIAQFYNVTDAALSADAQATITSLAVSTNSAGNVLPYTPHGIYFIETSMNSYALVLANKESNYVVELIIGYIY